MLDGWTEKVEAWAKLAKGHLPEREVSGMLETAAGMKERIGVAKAFLGDSLSAVTLAAYARLEEGMSYAQVVRIIGMPGTEMSRTSIAGFETVMYMWAAPGLFGGNMTAMFQNGALVSKSQFGLK
jgi:hypothetical protein